MVHGPAALARRGRNTVCLLTPRYPSCARERQRAGAEHRGGGGGQVQERCVRLVVRALHGVARSSPVGAACFNRRALSCDPPRLLPAVRTGVVQRPKDKLLTMDPKEITYEMVQKKLQEIAMARGKTTRIDRQEQVHALSQPSAGRL